MRSMDWSTTPLGPTEGWPESLRTATSIMLGSPLAVQLFWGDDLVLLYNDGMRPMMGDKHLAGFGRKGFDHWPEVREHLGPLLRDVLANGTSLLTKNGMVATLRSGFLEELYFSWSFSPLRVESGKIGAVFQVATETTREVLGERRQEVLRELAVAPSAAPSADEVCVRAARALRPEDVPFALLYLLDDGATTARLVATSGIEPGLDQSPRAVDLSAPGAASGWPLAEVERTHLPLVVDDLEARFGPQVARGWSVPPTRAMVLPLVGADDARPRGFLVAGISAGLHLDDHYRSFLDQIARQIAARVTQSLAAAAEAANARVTSALRRSEEIRRDDLRRLFEKVPVAMALLRGPEHVYELANDAYSALSANRRLIGQSVRQCFPELPESFHEILDRVYDTGEAVSASEVAIRLEPPGEPPKDLIVTFTYAPFRNHDGAPDGIVLAGFDVTEAGLARKQLEELTEQLRLADRRKDEFLAMLGHELRNPLAPIATATALMRLHGDHHAKERHVIERQVAHLSRLVEDLLDVARIARGQIELKRVPVEISEIVTRAVELASPLVAERAHRLSVDVPSHGLRVDGDAVRLAQVFCNLLTNAAKYTASGGHLEVRAARAGGEVVLTVGDDGPGITAELMPRLFDLFVQGTRSLDRPEGGLGLGLALVKNLVALHGGSVAARNRTRGGSEFSVRLPALDSAPPPRLPAAAARTPAPKTITPRRVLVVDDNRDAADLASELLSNVGHEVVVAYDGAEALAALDAFAADVALLDIGLPIMNGLELARRIRERAGGKAMRLVAITGYGQAHDREATRAAGFDAHLTKPVSAADILASVAKPD